MNRAIINKNLELNYTGNEAVNTICSNITFAGKNLKKIVITSCEPNDGKSFVSMQIAVNMAKRGKKVLLIDADMRMSVMNAHYGIKFEGSEYGLAHLLSGQCEFENATYETNIPNMHFMPIGAEVQTPLNLVATPYFGQLIQSVEDQVDMIIIDAPPVGVVIDAAEIAKVCDGSIIVCECAKTRKRALKAVKEQLDRTGTPILGCILNNKNPAGNDRVGHFGKSSGVFQEKHLQPPFLSSGLTVERKSGD